MSYVLIPTFYYDGFFSISMAGELAGYEAKKTFSPDIIEYTKSTAPIKITETYLDTSSIAMMYIGGTGFISLGEYNGSSYITKTPTGIYGTTKKLYLYYRSYNPMHQVSTTNGTIVNHIMYGKWIVLPDSKFRIERNFAYSYQGSEVNINLNGGITFDGIANNGVKRQGTLSFEYLTPAEKDLIVDIYNKGRGCLPLWFIDDIYDENSWILCSWKTLKLTEPFAAYFNIDISLVEF